MASLASPFSARRLHLRNRLVMPPMATGMARENGDLTPSHVEHYRKRAAAGVGLIIFEHSYVDLDGKCGPGQAAVDRDTLVDGFREVTKVVKGEGAAIALQITHAGSAAAHECRERRLLGPSPVPHPEGQGVPEELTVAEIARITDLFAAAAARAVKAGFDGVEIHGAHGYLLGQFLSPLTNLRTDEYGGTIDNRMRFPVQVTRAVRAAVGPDYPVLYRLGAWDGVKGGLMLDDAVKVAGALLEAGVDIIDVSGGMCGSRPDFLQGVQGYFVPLAARIRKESGAPVICTGGITEPEFANRLIKYDRVDLVGVGRALLADPDWARSALEYSRDEA
ncbi:MAG: NADH:flavin oxidoreductase [Ignavibacteriales bacterium]